MSKLKTQELTPNQKDVLALLDGQFSAFKLFPDGISDERKYEWFCSYQIIKFLNSNIDIDMLERGVVGNGGDGGIDSIYISLDSRLTEDGWDEDIDTTLGPRRTIDIHCIQATTSSGISKAKVSQALETIERLLIDGNLDIYKKHYNADLINAIEPIIKIRTAIDPIINLHFFYCTKGFEDVHPNILQDIESSKAKWKERNSKFNINFKFFKVEELFDYCRTKPSEIIDLKITKSMTREKDYVAFALIRDYKNFLTKENNINNDLFDYNIRAFMGNRKNSINNKILDSLQNPKDKFWRLNNGITIIAKDIGTPDETTMKLTDPKIVNGLQTSYSIFNFGKAEDSKLQNSQDEILIKIIKIGDNEEIKDRIIVSTNSQTPIPRYALNMTEDIHSKISLFFEKNYLGNEQDLFYEDKVNRFGSQNKPKKQIVTVLQMIKAVLGIFLQRPHDARGRPSNIFDEKNHEDYENIFSNHELLFYYSCIKIVKRIELFLEAKSLESRERADIIYYIAMCLVCFLLKERKPINNDIANINFKTIEESLIDKIYNKIDAVYTDFDRSSKNAKGNDMVKAVGKWLDTEPWK
ncbi:MAG: AIPR family protein [Hydrotalea sp.]|nr:AIPR family protein [Hydrotalea sp.]